MEVPPLRLPSFGYRSASAWSTGILIGGPLLTLLLGAWLNSTASKQVVNDELIGGIVASFAIPLIIYIAVQLWSTRGEPYAAFQRAVHDWAVQNYRLWLTPKQLRRLTRPLPKRASAFLPPDLQGALPLFGADQGWYTGQPIKLEGHESSAPALAGRRLSITLVTSSERSLLVTVPFGVPLPHGEELAAAFHKDEAYVPYSTASIAGLIAAGVFTWLALCALGIWALVALDPAVAHELRGAGRVVAVLAIFPPLPLFHAAGSRARENASHR